jgi:hypothetical protein
MSAIKKDMEGRGGKRWDARDTGAKVKIEKTGG